MPDGEDLQRLGVKIERFPALNRAEECANLAAIPQASAQFQFNRQRLVLSIPQAALENRVRGYVPPELWDEGMPAMLVNYGFTGSNSKGRDRFTQSASSYYLNLRPGFNLGPGGCGITPPGATTAAVAGGSRKIAGTPSIPTPSAISSA